MPTAWHDAADWYDQLVADGGSEYHRHVVLPGVLRLLAVQPGESVLDVACGQGVLCRLLAERGARVVGLDAARPLIDAARQRSSAGNGSLAPSTPCPQDAIAYRTGDARELVAMTDLADRFDAAACVLAIQNIHPFAPVFTGIAQCLHGGGRVVIAMMHPAFRGPRHSQWHWNDDQTVQSRLVDRYLIPRKHPIVTHPGKDPTRHTWTFHRPLQDYVKALRHAGLYVDAIEEWASHKHSDSGPRAKAENLARKEIPMFMALRAVKVAIPAGG